MKTTVEVQDTLMQEVKQIAYLERRSVRSLIEEGLRRVLTSREQQPGSNSVDIEQFVHQGKAGFAKGFNGQWEDIKEEIRSVDESLKP